MDIKQMTPEEKSVMLARLCGWLIEEKTFDMTVWEGSAKAWYGLPGKFNLYDPANMHLALKCIRWGMENSAEFNELVAGHAYHMLRLETGIADTLDEMLKIYAVDSIV